MAATNEEILATEQALTEEEVQERLDFLKRCDQELKDWDAKQKLSQWKRARFRILHQRICNYQKKLGEAKQEYWELWDYFKETTAWKSMRDRDEVVQKLEEKFGIVNRR